MSKADDVFIRQFIIVLVLLAAYGVGAGVLGVWIANAARDASAGSERATLERIAPVGKLKLGEPGKQMQARAGAGKAASESAAAAASDEGSTAERSAPAATPATTAPAAMAVAAATAPAATSPPPPTAAIDEAAEKIYKQYCFACHLSGVAEAPKTGDTEAWAPRAANGFDALFASVVNGKGAMPPRAGFPQLSDDELKAGIRYLLAIANLTAE